MSDADRMRWDERYAARAPSPGVVPGPPECFAAVADEFPTGGRGLEIACGTGVFAVWLALRGIEVTAVDVSPVAIDCAAVLARRVGVDDRCRFSVADLDDGLPPGPPVDVLVCQLFRDPRLDGPIVERLAPGGLLAISVLSEVGATPGRFRARPGALTAAFGGLHVVTAGESDGRAWLLARRTR